MRFLPTLAALVSILAAPLAAQRTWVVDEKGGTGHDFKTLAPAIAAARAGDTVLVRPGSYDMSTSITKGINLIGEAGAVLEQRTNNTQLRIWRVPATEMFSMRGFRISTRNIAPPFKAMFVAESNAGRLIFEDLKFDNNVLAPGGDVLLTWNTAMTWDRCQLPRKVTMYSCHVVCVKVDFAAPSGANAAVFMMSRNRAEFVQCSAQGSNFGGLAYPALRLMSSHLVLRGDANSKYRGAKTHYEETAIRGDRFSSLDYDPDVDLGTLRPDMGGPSRKLEMPFLLGSAGKLGATLDLELHSAPGHAFQLFVGLAGKRLSFQGLGDVWIDPMAYLEAARGIQGRSGRTTFQRSIPASPGLLGLKLTYQALSGSGPAVATTNPASTVLSAR